jgi:hypothetical protein
MTIYKCYTMYVRAKIKISPLIQRVKKKSSGFITEFNLLLIIYSCGYCGFILLNFAILLAIFVVEIKIVFLSA